jgi:hypothetical protein
MSVQVPKEDNFKRILINKKYKKVFVKYLKSQHSEENYLFYKVKLLISYLM